MGGLQCAVYLQAGTGMAHVSLNASDTPNSLPVIQVESLIPMEAL